MSIYFSVNNNKLPQLTYSSNNMKTTSYINQISVPTQHLSLIDNIENPESISFISKPKNILNYTSLFTQTPQNFPFVSNNSYYSFSNTYSFGSNFISNETPLYTYICNYLSPTAMIKDDYSYIIYSTQANGITNTGYPPPLEQINVNIPILSNNNQLQLNDNNIVLTFILYDPNNKYKNKNVIITITTFTTPIYGDRYISGYNRTYTFNISCDPKFVFEIYISNRINPPLLSLQINLDQLTIPSIPLIINNTYYNPNYYSPYTVKYTTIEENIFSSYYQASYTFIVQNVNNYSYKLYAYDPDFSSVVPKPKVVEVTEFSDYNSNKLVYVNCNQTNNNIICNVGVASSYNDVVLVYILVIIDNDTGLQLSVTFPVLLNFSNQSSAIQYLNNYSTSIDYAIDIPTISLGIYYTLGAVVTYLRITWYFSLTGSDIPLSEILLETLLSFLV
jgi:hypothetical protein